MSIFNTHMLYQGWTKGEPRSNHHCLHGVHWAVCTCISQDDALLQRTLCPEPHLGCKKGMLKKVYSSDLLEVANDACMLLYSVKFWLIFKSILQADWSILENNENATLNLKLVWVWGSHASILTSYLEPRGLFTPGVEFSSNSAGPLQRYYNVTYRCIAK